MKSKLSLTFIISLWLVGSLAAQNHVTTYTASNDYEECQL